MKYVLFLLLLLPFLSFAQIKSKAPLQAKGYLIVLEEDEQLESLSSSIDPAFLVEKVISKEYKMLHIRHPSGRSFNDLLLKIKKQPGIKYAQLNHPVQVRQNVPNDPFWEAQWNLHKVGVLSMFQQSLFGQTTQGTPIVLGILEPNGFDTRHEDLIHQFWRNESEVPGDGLDNDDNGYIDDYLGWNALQSNDEQFSVIPHGTLVAGLASASNNNELGITSIGWNSKLLLLSGNHYESEVIENYLYALALRKRFNESQGKEGAFIVATNASFGTNGAPEDFPIWCEIYNRLGAQGILSISAADNKPFNTDLRADMPTSCNSEYLITVTGVDAFDNFISGHAYGPETVDIAAPASQILTTAPNNTYVEVPVAGTSYAAPQITGAIGLMYSLPYEQIQQQAIHSPDATALLMKTFLLNGVQTLPTLKGKIRSEGRLDLQRTHQLLHRHFNQPIVSLKINKIYPNPFTSRVIIDCYLPTQETYNFQVVDLQGRIVTQLDWDNHFVGQQTIDLPLDQLGAGVYFLKIASASATATHKMVKIAY